MHSKPKILIVGDTNEQGTIRSDYLATFGYSTGSASTGAEALQQIRAEALDLVIIEEPLPDTSCHELCEQIRRLSGRNLPAIVLITKSKHLPTQKNGERLEADDILLKPIHTEVVPRIRTGCYATICDQRRVMDYESNPQESPCEF
jgi:DNA-binding response OmpR family regulator